ncbi:HD-GYP domain-containing protein, partial [Vibrio sp. 03_296]|uniref:HD-GYP domain-containing protein n=1 Tax=Vibrio sp. 03_296 TaxID=2024409 RepID=UPI0034E8A622
MISEKLAQLYGLSDFEVNLIKQRLDQLHDVASGDPDSILHKPGKLDAQEWEIMKKRRRIWRQHLELNPNDASFAIAKESRWDTSRKVGRSGYPMGLKGESIPISGRITGLADVFDALGAKRSYKEPWSDEQIRQEIEAQKGKHFDPRLVD